MGVARGVNEGNEINGEGSVGAVRGGGKRREQTEIEKEGVMRGGQTREREREW